jgi:DNA polymerase sigma
MNYPNLKEVSIVLKMFLAKLDLNTPYFGKTTDWDLIFIGGISSYSLVLLIVAYMNYFKIKDTINMTPSRLLMGFLDYYGNYFNPSSLGISVINEG